MGPPLDYWFQGLPTSAVTAIAVTTAATTTTTRMKLRITRENTVQLPQTFLFEGTYLLSHTPQRWAPLKFYFL